MNQLALIYAFLTFLLWGSSAFLDKLAANRLGDRGSWIITLASIPAILLMVFYALLARNNSFDGKGLWILIISWILSSLGAITYYLVFTRAQVSVGAPLTALYPILAVVLGVIFLNERLTIYQSIGIIFGIVSIYLLSK